MPLRVFEWARVVLIALALFLLALVLGGCAETPGPLTVEAVTALPSQPAATETAAPSSAATTSREPTATDAEGAIPAATDTAAASSAATAAPEAEGSLSVWPRFVRQLDFSIPAGNSYGPRALAVHPGLGRIYARTHRQGVQGPGIVTVLDADDGQVLAVVETGPDNYAEGGLALDVAQDRLYAVNRGDSTATVLDAQSLQTLAILDGVEQLALDGQRGRLYIAGLTGLRRVDTEGYQAQQQVELPGAPRFVGLAVGAGGDRVYLASQQAGGYTLSWHDANTLQPLGSRSLPGPLDSLVADGGRGHLYLTLNDGEHARLWVLDGSGELLWERQLGDWTQHTYLALDERGDRLFLGRDAYGDYGISILDLQTGEEAGNLSLEQGPQALVWDGDSGRLLASHTYQNRIAALEPRPGGARAAFPTALNVVDLAVDPPRSKLYVTDSAGQMHVLGSETGREEAVVPGEGRISLDSTHARLYTGGEGARQVRIFDLDPLVELGQIPTKAAPVADVHAGGLYLVRSGIHLTSLETLTITGAISDTLPDPAGFSPNPAAVDAVVDPESGRLLAIVNNGVPGSNNGNYLYVYEREEDDSYRRVLSDTERSVAYVDVDGTSERAYVARRYMNQHATSLLVAGREYTARVDALSGPLRVDPGLGRLYLSVVGQDEGTLLVLDAKNLDVLGTVSLPAGFGLRAVDTQRHLLYLARREGEVQIWSATGGGSPPSVEPQPTRLPVEDVTQFTVGPGGSPLLAGSLYRSTNDGQSWDYVGSGLPGRGVAEVAVSPGYAQDQTLFAALAATDEGLGIWRSTDGGRTWHMASAGLSDLAVTDLGLSPAFAADHTLFATTRKQGLFRSTDGGQSWTRLTERYLQLQGYNEPAGLIALSPTYGQDRTLFVAHDGLQRSTDGGQRWVTLSVEVPESLALSPDFADDGTLYGWFGSVGLLRSTDRGDSWQPIGQGLPLSSYGHGQILLPSIRQEGQSVEIYFLWMPAVSGGPAAYYRSRDGGATWQQLAGPAPQGITPVRLAEDGSAFLTLDAQGRLARWPTADLAWQPVTAPPVSQVEFYDLAFSPDFAADGTLYALSQGADIYRSRDAGLTWQPTGFPLRPSSAEAPPLLVLPGQVLLLGSRLGLTRAEEGGRWIIVGGGLPPGRAATTPCAGADGSLRLLSGTPEDEQRVFVSTDGGQTWSAALPPLPLPAIAEDLHLSPALSSDGTAFLTASSGRPLRSVDGGPWQEVGPPGDWSLSAFHMSPAFDHDGMLLLRLDDHSLWRSTDRGETWQALDGPWDQAPPAGIAPGPGYRLPAVTFSAAYHQDGVLLTQVGMGLYRSTDAGETWTRVLDLGPRFVQATFSPQYAEDGLIYMVQGATLYRSTDRGQRWEQLPAPPWSEGDQIGLEISPTFDRDDTLLAWSLSGPLLLSQDGGRAWQEARAGLPEAAIRRPVLSPRHAADGLIYLIPHAPGLYKWFGAGPWVPVTQVVARATPAPATPTPTPPPLACASEPEQFRAVWQQARGRLGCPEGTALQLLLAEQPFERGHMIWDSDQQQIYVLFQSGRWQAFADTWREGIDPTYDPDLPPPPQQPQRGFGKVWREQLGGPQPGTPGDEIGWATAAERAVDGWRQAFDQGLLFWTDAVPPGSSTAGAAYLLFEDGSWQTIPAPRP